MYGPNYAARLVAALLIAEQIATDIGLATSLDGAQGCVQDTAVLWSRGREVYDRKYEPTSRWSPCLYDRSRRWLEMRNL